MKAPWEVICASVRGATHSASRTPLQDAFAFAGDGLGNPLVVAVADGHGHPRHYRSERGAHLAVQVGIEVVGAAVGTTGAVDQSAVASNLITLWGDRVVEDWDRRPREEDEGTGYEDDEPLLAYGTTLLIAAITPESLAMWQIGDGDMVVLFTDGTSRVAVPDDGRLDGWRTTSMCQPDALDAFRWDTVKLADSPLRGLLAATDGVGNAQVSDPWQGEVLADLATMVGAHGVDWMRRELQAWVGRCASGEGSGDDATAALIVKAEG